MVVKDERYPGSKSFIWVHTSGKLFGVPPIVVYCYEKTRGTDHLRNFYADLLQMIYLTSDAYSAYALHQEDSLRMFLTDGNIPLDNGYVSNDLLNLSAYRNLRGMKHTCTAK